MRTILRRARSLSAAEWRSVLMLVGALLVASGAVPSAYWQILSQHLELLVSVGMILLGAQQGHRGRKRRHARVETRSASIPEKVP